MAKARLSVCSEGAGPLRVVFFFAVFLQLLKGATVEMETELKKKKIGQ